MTSSKQTPPPRTTPTPDNQGEGNRDAARRYNDDQKRFVESGAVADSARHARPETDQQAQEMLDAEEQGRRKAKGEDPTVPGANARKAKQKTKRGGG
jgi:hypothetical protein